MASFDMYSDGWSPVDALADDAGGRALGEMMDVLTQRRAEFKAMLDKGVSPAEFKQGTALLASYDAALKGLERAWKRRFPQ